MTLSIKNLLIKWNRLKNRCRINIYNVPFINKFIIHCEIGVFYKALAL